MFRIPNHVHFCFGLDSSSDSSGFGILEYLAIRSARDVLRPDSIVLHSAKEFRGEWWERISPCLQLNLIDPPKEIFGNPLRHYAHQSDIVRLDALIEHGGIYLDMDTLCLRPFNDLRRHAFVMGIQPGRGLCNAVMLGEPQSVFAKHWKEQYRTFNGRKWDRHSVVLPQQLARTDEMKDHIKVISDHAFFWPLWEQTEEYLFRSADNALFEDSYCIHLWNHANHALLDRVDLDFIRMSNCNFSQFAKKHLEEFL